MTTAVGVKDSGITCGTMNPHGEIIFCGREKSLNGQRQKVELRGDGDTGRFQLILQRYRLAKRFVFFSIVRLLSSCQTRIKQLEISSLSR